MSPERATDTIATVCRPFRARFRRRSPTRPVVFPGVSPWASIGRPSGADKRTLATNDPTRKSDQYGRGPTSVPEIPLIELDPMASQKCQELVAKRRRPVMFGLSAYVFLDPRDIRVAHAERAVTGLPCETSPPGEGIVNPFRGTGLDRASGIGDSHRRMEHDEPVGHDLASRLRPGGEPLHPVESRGRTRTTETATRRRAAARGPSC
jgi:hypothetical protein